MLIQTGTDNPTLRAPNAAVPPDQIRKFKKFAAQMVDYVKDPKNGSCGLAAPQVGKNIRLAAVAFLKSWDDEDARVEALFNPEISWRSPETDCEKEGCLSLPGAGGLVTRHRAIRLKWTDKDGKPHDRAYEGVPARIVQHELDHLDGVLFMDKALPLPPENA